VNSCGCVTDTTYINRISVDPTPTANFNSPNPTSCNSPHNVTFNNTSSGAGLNYFWDFGDGTTSTATNPSHSYTTGNYTVTLIATNPVTGCADTFVRSNYVNISNVTANFNSANPAGCVGQQICFTNTSTPPGATYSWDFGDGSGTSTAANPCYTYSAPGTYTVSLTVTANGCSDTRTINNYVSINTAPTVDFFTLDDTITCLYPYTVNWQNNSPPGLTYSWTFNGGTPNTANTFNPPPITYGVSGGNARLTVTDGNGCSSILAKPIQIQPVNARFTVDQNRGCAPQILSLATVGTLMAIVFLMPSQILAHGFFLTPDVLHPCWLS
jgi:PKD repeat protein